MLVSNLARGAALAALLVPSEIVGFGPRQHVMGISQRRQRREVGHLRAVAAGLRRHGRDNAVAGALQQVPDEGAADAEPSTMKSRTPR